MKGMTTVRFLRPKQDSILRIIADALMLNVAILTALALRLFYMAAFNRMPLEVSYNLVCWDSLAAYSLKFCKVCRTQGEAVTTSRPQKHSTL